MSTFSCEVVRLEILPHGNADALELAKIGDYLAVVRKGQFKSGDLAVYIPEQAVVPEWLLRHMGLWDEVKCKGGLSGGAGNRVKAVRLRGVLSQGLVLPGVNLPANEEANTEQELVVGGQPRDDETVPVSYFFEGDDAAEFLGIVKYEPAIPSHMSCKIIGTDFGNTHKYDFENLKKNPDMFLDGEEVVITEKIHGTNIQIGVVPTSAANPRYYKDRVFVTSKGMGGNGFVLDHNDPTNLYAQAAIKHGLLDAAYEVLTHIANQLNEPVLLFGEVFGVTNTGKGVQDLTYTGQPLDLRLFDMSLGVREKAEFTSFRSFEQTCKLLNVKTAPVLYIGPYSKQVVLGLTDGPTTLIPPRGKMAHIREGVVVKTAVESRDHTGCRKIAKSISDAYLLRKEATEFN